MVNKKVIEIEPEVRDAFLAGIEAVACRRLAALSLKGSAAADEALSELVTLDGWQQRIAADGPAVKH